MKYKKKIKVVFHFMIWTAILIILVLIHSETNNSFSTNSNFAFIIIYLYLISFFYLNAEFLIVKLILNKRYFIYFLSIGCLFVLYIYLHKYIISLSTQTICLLPPILTKDNIPPSDKQNAFQVGILYILPLTQFLLFWMLSTCYRFILEWVFTNKKNRKIELEKSIIERSYLKMQINTHFIVNTLNAIYSLAINKNEKAPYALLLYSQTVHYSLDKLNINFVPLREEIDYVTSYIKLQTLRFTDSLNVIFDTQGKFNEYMIAPLILIPFIENSFQYGVSNHYPSIIFIYIEASDNKIHFISKNKKYENNKLRHIGKNIGIINVLKRLNLIYPNYHKISIKETEDYFCVDLLIFIRDT